MTVVSTEKKLYNLCCFEIHPSIHPFIQMIMKLPRTFSRHSMKNT